MKKIILWFFVFILSTWFSYANYKIFDWYENWHSSTELKEDNIFYLLEFMDTRNWPAFLDFNWDALIDAYISKRAILQTYPH